MSARYQYIPMDVRPPAPFVHVTLRPPVGDGEIAYFPAQLDTGADRTVIPRRVVESLGLVQLDEIRVGGFGGSLFTVPTFAVRLELRLFPAITIEAAASRDETWVLLGRDVLNRYRFVLDGPQLTVEVG